MAEGPLHETIEKYLLGELSPPERERLEAKIAADPALFQQVEIQRLALMGLQRLAAADLREKFDQWDEDLDAPPPNASPPQVPERKFWIWATATLLLLLLAGAFWHFWQLGKVQKTQDSENREITQRDSVIAAMRLEFQQIQDSLSVLMNLPRDSFSALEIKRLREEIGRKDKVLRDLEAQRRAGKPQIAMQFAQSPNTITRGGNSDTEDSILAAEEKAFNAKEFTESIRLLMSIPANDPRQAEVKQRLPYSLFYANDFEAAIPAFVDLLEADQFEEMNVQWHLLLCYVATGKNSETRYLLHMILKNPKHKYYQKAADLEKLLSIR